MLKVIEINNYVLRLSKWIVKKNKHFILYYLRKMSSEAYNQ
jgi:hypothetical protein